MEIIKTSTKGKIFHTKKSKANLVNKQIYEGKTLVTVKEQISRVRILEL